MLGVLPPLLGEALLRRRGPVRVVQALDVAAQHRPHADALHEPVEVHDHAGLVAVDIGEDDAGFDRRLTLSIGPTVPSSSAFISDDVLAVLDAGEDGRQGILDRACHLEQHVDAVRFGEADSDRA